MSRYLETIKVVDGEIFHLEYHQKRLNATLNSRYTHSLKESLHPPKKGLFRCRVLYDESSIDVEYIPYTKRSVKRLKLITANGLEYAKKYADREALSALFEQRGECDDVLIIKNSLICDTTIANIALYDGKDWFTPKSPLLFGTTRARYLQNREIKERDITPDSLNEYKKVALMNAMIDFDIIAVEKIEDIMC